MATNDQLKSMDPDEVFNGDIPVLDSALEELGIQIGKGWSKSKKEFELSRAIENLNSDKIV